VPDPESAYHDALAAPYDISSIMKLGRYVGCQRESQDKERSSAIANDLRENESVQSS
jgi:hypothetical protein